MGCTGICFIRFSMVQYSTFGTIKCMFNIGEFQRCIWGMCVCKVDIVANSFIPRYMLQQRCGQGDFVTVVGNRFVQNLNECFISCYHNYGSL